MRRTRRKIVALSVFASAILVVASPRVAGMLLGLFIVVSLTTAPILVVIYRARMRALAPRQGLYYPPGHRIYSEPPRVVYYPPAHEAYPEPAGERNPRFIPQDVRVAVAVRDNGRCRECGSADDIQYDHVIPWSRGGASTVANVQLLCGTCNRRKSDRTEE